MVATWKINRAWDLKGGLQVLLASDLPGGAQPTVEQMDAAKRIIEDRVNGLGVAEPIVQAAQDNRILVELPGVTDRNLAIDLIKQTGQLEFVDAGFNPPPEGQPISTTYSIYRGLIYSNTVSGGLGLNVDATRPDAVQLLNTAFTGEILQSATPGLDNLSRYIVQFGIKPEYQAAFQQFTSSRQNQAMCIVLDKKYCLAHSSARC